MGSWLRQFVVWLMVAALPVHGVAAATLQGCGPSHHGRQAAQTARTAAATAHAQAQAQAHAHVHTHAHHAADPAAHGHGDTGPAAKKSPGSKCPACAACCAGAVLPVSPLVFAAFKTPSEAIARPLPASLGVVARTPERPPRSPLA